MFEYRETFVVSANNLTAELAKRMDAIAADDTPFGGEINALQSAVEAAVVELDLYDGESVAVDIAGNIVSQFDHMHNKQVTRHVAFSVSVSCTERSE